MPDKKDYVDTSLIKHRGKLKTLTTNRQNAQNETYITMPVIVLAGAKDVRNSSSASRTRMNTSGKPSPSSYFNICVQSATPKALLPFYFEKETEQLLRIKYANAFLNLFSRQPLNAHLYSFLQLQPTSDRIHVRLNKLRLLRLMIRSSR